MSAIRREAGFIVDYNGRNAISTARRRLYVRFRACNVIARRNKLQRLIYVLPRRAMFAILVLCHSFGKVHVSFGDRQLFKGFLRDIRGNFNYSNGATIRVAFVRFSYDSRHHFAIKGDYERNSILRFGRRAVRGERHVLQVGRATSDLRVAKRHDAQGSGFRVFYVFGFFVLLAS